MRTCNTKCVICDKPLYRRPSEFKAGVEFCCKGCRGELYKRRPPSPNLELGRVKGENHLKGIKKSEASNNKRSISHKQFYKEHPEVAIERGKKNRGENNYNWKGGVNDLNVAIRLLWENRKWQNKVKDRDGRKCVECNSTELLEAHHIKELSEIIEIYDIKNIDEARVCEELWNIENGITLCECCHYKKHNRTYDNRKGNL